MAPMTRLTSAQSSPMASKLNSNTHTPSTTPSKTSSRKTPCCRTCNQPMKGHPKSSCLNSDSAKKEDAEEDEEEQPLTSALKSMKLASSPGPALLHQREEDNKVFIRARRRQSQSAAMGNLVSSDTLLSLSTNSSEIVGRILQTGMSGDNPEAEGDDAGFASKIVRWQESVAIKKSMTAGRQLMPGTLIPPTPDASFKSEGDGLPQRTESPPKKIRVVPPSEDSTSTVTVHRTQPLSRSMSSMERDSFMSNLSKQAAATIYAVPKVDAEDLQTQAVNLKYSTHLIVNEGDPHAFLILGRNESSVKALAKQVHEEKRNVGLNKGSKSGSSSNLKAVAGAAVVGAVGTWAGLAFT